ncbi:MAG: DUF4446 family protein [Peptoniphilaceae bacterium]|nr:DUF4446 family protein [Peptoniphilaceae bacterium]
MSNGIIIAVLVLLLLMVTGSFYAASNMNKKLNRMRRRYDMLLRGHGEVSMEELLNGMHDEMQQFSNERKQTEQKLYHVEQWMARTDTDQSAHVDERFDALSHQLTEEMRAATGNMRQTLTRMDEEVFARMDQVETETRDRLTQETAALRAQLVEEIQKLTRKVKKDEEDAYIHFDTLEKETAKAYDVAVENFKRLDQDLEQRTMHLEKSFIEKLVNFQGATENRFLVTEKQISEDIDALRTETRENVATLRTDTSENLSELRTDTSEALSELRTDTSEALSTLRTETTEHSEALAEEVHQSIRKLDEETTARVTEFQADINEYVRSENERLSDQLSLAIRKVYLHRYNAFDDVAGETSFTAVLLDEHRNGIILTSIYARQNSTTFAKEVRSGEPQQKLSPEEAKALQEAMKR